MIFLNLEVKHKSFGTGVVVSQNGKYMTVKFDSTQKIFVYPDAFESFLTLADGTVSEEIMLDIQSTRNAKQAIIQKKNEENIRAMQKGIVIPGKDGVIAMNDENQDYKSNETDEIV